MPMNPDEIRPQAPYQGAEAVVAARAAAHLHPHVAFGQVEIVVDNDDVVRFVASQAVVMNVAGFRSVTSSKPRLIGAASAFFFLRQEPPCRRASSSATRKPTLWRVRS